MVAPGNYSAVRVYSSAKVTAGDVVDIDGSVATDVDPNTSCSTGERIINATSVVVRSLTETVRPLAVNGRLIPSGPANGTHPQCSVELGRNNVGTLVRISGKVTSIDADYGYFYIDDGAGLSDGLSNSLTSTPNVGVRVVYSGCSLAENDLCIVTGVLSSWADDAGGIHPVLLTQSSTALIPPVPFAPASLTAEAGNASVYLSWSTVNSIGVNIYRKPSGGTYSLLASTSTSQYTDQAVVNGTTYF